MNSNYFSNINAKYLQILEFQNLLKVKGFLDLQPKPICKIYNHTFAFCSDFVTGQESAPFFQNPIPRIGILNFSPKCQI
jgi:hypothetical protein